MSYQYVLYNTCYGGFSVNTQFLIELFKHAYTENKIADIFKIEKLEKTKEEILQKIQKNDDYDSDIDGDNIEYFSNYIITQNKIYNFDDNTYIYISPYNDQFRSKQFVIEYIFDRCIKKILKDNNFTPFFYNLLSKIKPEIYANIYDEKEQNYSDLIYIEPSLLEEINSFSCEHKILKRLKNVDDIHDVKYYKNGIKINDKYYKFKFDTNINKDNIYDVLNSLDYDEFINYLLFHDINGGHADLSIEKIKTCYDWNIREYDGQESVIVKLPYEKIIHDLLNKLWNTENYQPQCILSNELINKIKTLEETKKEMYS
jgi:hypothetical protein